MVFIKATIVLVIRLSVMEILLRGGLLVAQLINSLQITGLVA